MTGTAPFIYALEDPAAPGHIRYVGMALRPQRPYEHAKKFKRSDKHSHLFNWLRSMQLQGRTYVVRILETLPESCGRDFVGFVEKCYIGALREIGHSLTNVSDGGWGGNTGDKTPDMRAAVGNANSARVWTPEMRANAREATLARYQNPAERAKHSVPRSVESRVKQSAAARGIAKTETHRARQSEALKAYYDTTPGAHDKHREDARKGWKTRRANAAAKAAKP